jgi:hypothetical protein
MDVGQGWTHMLQSASDLLVVECTWFIGPNLVWLRYGNFSALLYTAFSINLLSSEDKWRAYRTIVDHCFLNSFHVYRNIALNWLRTLPHFHFFLNRAVPCSCGERSHRFRGICCFHLQGCFCSAGKIEFATKIYGVTFQKTIVIFVVVSGLSHSSRHFIWRYVANFTHVTSWGNLI